MALYGAEVKDVGPEVLLRRLQQELSHVRVSEAEAKSQVTQLEMDIREMKRVSPDRSRTNEVFDATFVVLLPLLLSTLLFFLPDDVQYYDFSYRDGLGCLRHCSCCCFPCC